MSESNLVSFESFQRKQDLKNIKKPPQIKREEIAKIISLEANRQAQEIKSLIKQMEAENVQNPFAQPLDNQLVSQHYDKILSLIKKASPEDLEYIYPILDKQYREQTGLSRQYLGLRREILLRLGEKAIDMVKTDFDKAYQINPKKNMADRSLLMSMAINDLETLHLKWQLLANDPKQNETSRKKFTDLAIKADKVYRPLSDLEIKEEQERRAKENF